MSKSSKFPKLRFDQYVSVLALAISFLFLPNFAEGVTAKSLPLLPLEVATPKITTHLVVPIYTGMSPIEEQLANLTAPSIYVMDRESGAILFQKNAGAPRYPASTAKMMTALVAKQNYSLDTVLQVGVEAFALGSSGHLHLGEKITVRNLLSALLIPSGNDAALVLATHYPGGYSAFIDAMNKKAADLHLIATVFQNPSGLDANNQATTARDLAILGNEVMKDPLLREIVGHRQAEVTDVTSKIRHKLVSTQELLGVVDGVVGIKTGTTDFAGENLVTEVDRDNHQVILVVLGSKDRFAETKTLIDWVFANYDWQVVDHAAASSQSPKLLH